MRKFLVLGMVILGSLSFVGCGTQSVEEQVMATYRTQGTEAAIEKMNALLKDDNLDNIKQRIALLDKIMVEETGMSLETFNAAQSKQNDKVAYRSKMEISDVSINGDRGSKYKTISGSIKNTGDKDVSYYKITIDLMDDTGNVLNTIWTNNSGNFRPNTSSKWDKMVEWDDKYTKYRTFVEEVKF